MICHVGFGQAAPGKEKEAEQLLLQAAACVNKKHPSANVQVMRNISGQSEGILFVDMWDSLGAWEQASAAMEADPDWTVLVAKGEGLFAPGSGHHNFYRIVK